MKRLLKSEIDGQKIRRVLQTPYERIEGGTACEVYIELENGVLFTLLSGEEMENSGLQQASPRHDLIPAEFIGNDSSVNGETVATLIVSELLPVVGVQLLDGRIVTCRDNGPDMMAPFLFAVTGYYKGELFSFWDGQLLY